MLGLQAPRNSYYFIGKWQSKEDRTQMGNLRFKIVKSDDSFNTDINNMEGTEGTMTIETKSGLPIAVEDLFYFRGMKFNIIRIDGDMTKVDQQAFARFRANGNLATTLYLRKAG